MIEEYNTIESFFETKLKEKGSVFIGQCFPISSEDEAVSILETVRKKYYDATHHCYAWLTTSGSKYSDDGEPNGTAGLRIFNAIQHFKLNNILVIIIRYYGGVKLGVGPLGKAYYDSAFDTLKGSAIVTRTCYQKFIIRFEYDMTSQIHYILNKLNAKIQQSDYDSNVSITFLLKPSEIIKLESFLNDALSGKTSLEKKDELYFI